MSAKILDLVAARERREALALEGGISKKELNDWDKLLLRADHAWTYRDVESLLELSTHITYLTAQQLNESLVIDS